MKYKTCYKCKMSKPITDFHKNVTRKDGVQNRCKECSIRGCVEYYNQNRDKKLKYNKNRYNQNREKMLKYSRNHYNQNREKVLLYMKKYSASERGRIVKRASEARRRALKLGNTPTNLLLTTEQIEALYETTTHCPYCGVELSTVEIHLDHVQPLSKGGQHTLDNVVLCCAQCNMNKGAKEPIEWMLQNGIEFGFVTKAGYVSAYSTE